MEDRRARLIAELIHHLESLDGDELKSKMEPKAVEIEIEGDPKEAMPEGEGPMDKIMADKGEEVVAPKTPGEVDDEEMDDDDFEEMLKLSK